MFKYFLELILAMYFDPYGILFNRLINAIGAYVLVSDMEIRGISGRFAVVLLALVNIQGKFGVKSMFTTSEVLHQQCSINSLNTIYGDLIDTVKNLIIKWNIVDPITKKKNKSIIDIECQGRLEKQGKPHNAEYVEYEKFNGNKVKISLIKQDMLILHDVIQPQLEVTTSNSELTKSIEEGIEYNCNKVSQNALFEKIPHFNYDNLDNRPLYLHRCERNLVESAMRQFGGCNNLIDNDVLVKYQKYVKKNIIDVLQKVPNDGIDWWKWLDEVDPKKRELYKQHKIDYDEEFRFLKDADFITGHVTNYKIHTKTDEKIFIDPNTNKMKARAIIEESDIMKVLMGPIVKSLTRKSKQVFRWYGSGLNNGERCEKFKQWIDNLGGPECIEVLCLDGSAFDSTQHKQIKQALDHQYLVNEINSNIVDISKYCNIDHVYFAAKNELKIVKGKVDGTKVKLILDGTVGSGSMNTSNGNTKRSGSYIGFAADEAHLVEGVHYYFECCGDDVIIFIRKSFTDNLIYSLWQNVYADKSGVKHGLGQIAKIIERFSCIEDAEYLSCNFIVNEYGNIKMIRKIDRLLQLVPWSRSVKSNRLDKMSKELTEYASADYMEMRSWMGDIKLFNIVATRISNYHKINYYIKNYQCWNDRTDERDGSYHSYNASFTKWIERKFGIDKEQYHIMCQDIIKNSNKISYLDKIYKYNNLSQKSINKVHEIYKKVHNKKTYISISRILPGFTNPNEITFGEIQQ